MTVPVAQSAKPKCLLEHIMNDGRMASDASLDT